MPYYEWERAKDLRPADVLAGLRDGGGFHASRDRLEGMAAAGIGMENVDQRAAARFNLDLSDGYERVAEFESATAAADRALSIAREVDDDSTAVEALLTLARLHTRCGELTAARVVLEEILDACEDGDHSRGRCRAFIAIAAVELAEEEAESTRHSRNTRDTLGTLDEAFRIARRNQYTAEKGYALANVGAVYVTRGDHTRARDLISRAALLHQRTRDSEALGKAYANIGASYYEDRGRFVEAIPYLELGLDLIAHTGDLLATLNALSTLTSAWCHQDPDSPHDVRKEASSLIEALPSIAIGRMSDGTAIPLGGASLPMEGTYADRPIVSKALLFVSMPSRHTVVATVAVA